MVGDAGGAVVRAADEAEAVGQQRQVEHLVCVVLEGAQDVTTSLENCRTLIALRAVALLPDGLRFVSSSMDDTACIAYHGLAPH